MICMSTVLVEIRKRWDQVDFVFRRECTTMENNNNSNSLNCAKHYIE